MASFLSSLFGSKPSVPQLPVLNLGTEQGKAIASNQANLPAAENLVAQSNVFSQNQISSMLQAIIPGYNSLTSTASSNIESMLKGEIPSDVSGAVQDSAAARSLGLGIGGRGGSRDLVARDLGLTSLDITQKGLSSAESWISMMDKMYQPSQINVSSMFVTPQQTAAFDTQQQELQFQRDWMQNQISAMPDPQTVGLWNTG